MTWQRIGVIGGAIAVSITVIGGAWAGLDYLGIRPVVNSELRALDKQLQIVGKSVAWLNLKNLEDKLQRQGLTRRECAEYVALAKTLGIAPKAC